MFRLTFSNRLEPLLERLVVRVGGERDDPFEPAQVIVPSTAIKRRVQLALADARGVCANVQFSFLAQWLWTQIGRLVAVQRESPFDAEVLAWRIFELLGNRRFVDEHPRLAAYLRAADPAMRLELAQRVAALFEHYITYRSDWLARWADGRAVSLAAATDDQRADERWQADLWRRLGRAIGARGEHPGTTFLARAERRAVQGELFSEATGLPREVHVFALPSIPPLYLDLLRELSQWVDVHMWSLNPCREYWFDLQDRKRMARLVRAGRAAHAETIHPLLAGWGRQTQSQIVLTLADQEAIAEADGIFVESGRDTLLAQLQDQMLRLEPPTPGSMHYRPDEDRSIEVHACHSLTRQLEVLHDRLLASFAADPTLRPGDVLVVVPDLERAAPLVDSVFGTAPRVRALPYAITGLAQRRINHVARAFDDLLSLMSGRLPASAVFGLLEQPPVAERFGLADEELLRIHEWIREAGIRWGSDGELRTSYGLPATARHTFGDGLSRLYLAYAMGEATAPLGDRLGAGNPEGQSALALGRFWRFVSMLAQMRREWRTPRHADEWRSTLLDALERLVEPSRERIDEHRIVQSAIARLHANMTRGGLASAVPLEVVHAALRELLDEAARGGVPTGAITFASTASLRGLPYRIVCALGMDDGAFPRADQPAEFDLMALAPRAGDRQRRHDDRNTFLDLLLAARERFWIGYTGRSIRDNQPLPPSVLVSELLDLLADACLSEDADAKLRLAFRESIVVEHPLQPFSMAYFAATEGTDDRHRSFHAEFCRALAARRLAQRGRRQAVAGEALAFPGTAIPAPAIPRPGIPGPAVPGMAIDDPEISGEGELDEREAIDRSEQRFFDGTLAAPDETWRHPTIEELLGFLRNPSRTLLRQRLSIRLPEQASELLDDEPFTLDHAARRQLVRRLLVPVLEGADASSLRALALAGTEVPSGRFGERQLDRELRSLTQFGGTLRVLLESPAVEAASATIAFDLDGERWTLETALSDLRTHGIVRYRYDELRAADRLDAWLRHLALCALAPAGVSCRTRWLARDGLLLLRECAPARAQALLADLMVLYREGLRRPLPFFAKSAWRYVDRDGDLAAALRVWDGGRDPRFAEGNEPHHALAWRGIADPLGEEFARLAHRVYDPLREHIVEAAAAASGVAA